MGHDGDEDVWRYEDEEDGHEGYEGHEKVDDRQGQACQGPGLEGHEGEDCGRLEEGEPEEEQGWQDRLEGQVGVREEALRWQRSSEVDHGRAGGEEGLEHLGHGACRWKDRPGPRFVREGKGTLQGGLSDDI